MSDSRCRFNFSAISRPPSDSGTRCRRQANHRTNSRMQGPDTRRKRMFLPIRIAHDCHDTAQIRAVRPLHSGGKAITGKISQKCSCCCTSNRVPPRRRTSQPEILTGKTLNLPHRGETIDTTIPPRPIASGARDDQ